MTRTGSCVGNGAGSVHCVYARNRVQGEGERDRNRNRKRKEKCMGYAYVCVCMCMCCFVLLFSIPISRVQLPKGRKEGTRPNQTKPNPPRSKYGTKTNSKNNNKNKKTKKERMLLGDQIEFTSGGGEIGEKCPEWTDTNLSC